MSLIVIAGLALVGLVLFGSLVVGVVAVLISASLRPATVGALRFGGWIAGALCLMALLSFFVAVPQQAHDRQVAAGEGSTVDSLLATTIALPPARRTSAVSLTNDNLLFDDQVSETAGRPEWLDQPPALRERTYRMAVSSGLYVTQAECRHARAAALAAANGDD